MNICPFLGLRNDTTLHMAFGSSKNSCHHCKPVVPIKLDHQNHYCLDPIYISCPVYLDALDRRMPKQFIPTGWVNHRLHPKAKHILLIRASLAGIFLVIVIAFILASKEHAKNSIPIPFNINEIAPLTVMENLTVVDFTNTPLKERPQGTGNDSGTPLPFIAGAVPQIPVSTITVRTSSITEITTVSTNPLPKPAKISLHSLDVPIGWEQFYIIHKVVYGENLNGLADKYHTSFEAIKAVNYTLVIPIRKGAFIIFPLRNKESKGLPVLKPYQVMQKTLTVEALVNQLQTDLLLFKHINGLREGEELQKGDWFLVPSNK